MAEQQAPLSEDIQLDENQIRIAAMLAAYYSTFKDSSSVSVDYTRIKYIKKIPGKRACFITYTHQKTIYIDPDVDFINSLEVKRKWKMHTKNLIIIDYYKKKTVKVLIY